MRTSCNALIYISLIALFFSGCKEKEDEPEPMEKSAMLEVAVRDAQGVIVVKAEVKLYRTFADFWSETNQIGITQRTSSIGSTLFINLTQGEYYVLCRKGPASNQDYQTTKYIRLEKGQQRSLAVFIN